MFYWFVQNVPFPDAFCTILCPWQTYNRNPLQKQTICLTFYKSCKMLDKLLAFAMDFECIFAMGKVLCKMHLEMEHFAQTSKTYHFYIYKIQGKILLFSLILIYAKIYIFIETK